jgi:hypothetical protein
METADNSSDSGQPISDVAQLAARAEEKMKTESQFKSGANWFFWIAGLSLVNSIILLAGGSWNFIVGLGITQVIDAVAFPHGAAGKIVALFADFIAAGIYIIFGVLARKGYGWVFILGMVLYGIDGLIFLAAKDILGFGFHLLALWFILGGYRAGKKLKVMQPALKP